MITTIHDVEEITFQSKEADVTKRFTMECDLAASNYNLNKQMINENIYECAHDSLGIDFCDISSGD